MPRIVRKRPLWDRMTSTLNPMDFLLWLSEEIETRDWDSGLLGTQFGLGINFLFLIVRANSGSKQTSEDIFGDNSSSSWLAMLLYPLSWALIALSAANAVYTVARTRNYRLFGADIEVQPSTPSARRVRVESSPMTSSPLRLIADMVSPDSAESRAHPEKHRDVWELSVWDPLPACIRLLCLFSPGHVLIYLISLPLAPLDPRPSVTIFNTLIMQVVLSVQMVLLSSRYSQQAADNAIIQKEVFHEYDSKFVQPRIHPMVRDVGTQIAEDQPAISREFVQVGTPTTLVKRAFISSGNPHADADGRPSDSRLNSPAGNLMSPHMFTPSTESRRSELFSPALSGRLSSRLRHSLPAENTPTNVTPVAYAPTTPSAFATGIPSGVTAKIGGNLGVYSHNRSPLKKQVSMNDIGLSGHASPRNSREMAAYEQRSYQPPSSPTKPSDSRRFTGTNMTSSPHPFANMGKHSASERFPKLRRT